MRYLYLILICFAYKGYAKRTKEKIYVDISESGRAACFRRLNGTHQIGCSSSPKGNVGVVHYINSSGNRDGDLDWLINHGPHEPYAVLLDAVDFNLKTVNRLRSSGKVNGIMVRHTRNADSKFTSPIPAAFSPDKACPNDQYGLYSNHPQYKDCAKVKWNSVGEGMMFEDFGFPIYILTSEENVTFIIEKCYKKFNEPFRDGAARDYPLCAVQLKDRMDGAKDSETCIRRTRHQANLSPDRYCDPLGDKNVYATVKKVTNTDSRKDNSVIIAAARLDSFSMFEDYYPSADNHVSGIVALLAAAEAIGKVKQDIIKSDSKDIMFTFFQGEAFDYIGSGRMAYEMEKNNFPLPYGKYLHTINLPHISHFVEVNQLAYRDAGKVWIHTDPISKPTKSTEIDKMISDLKAIDESLIDSVENQPLPPASVQSFLKKNIIPAVVITDHKNDFTNKYYNSRFDLAEQIKVDYTGVKESEQYDYVTEQAANLTKVATLLAKFLYKTATGNNATEDVFASNSTVTHLLYCYLIKPNCELFAENLNSDQAKDLADKPYSFYVSVASPNVNHYTHLTKQLLLKYLGDKAYNVTDSDACKKKDEEDNVNHYRWVQGPKGVNGSRMAYCLVGTANTSEASSMAFEIDDYDYKSTEFSTWTESSWASDAMEVRFFMLPDKTFETTTLVLGVVIFLSSMLLTYFINRRTDVLFAQGPSRRY